MKLRLTVTSAVLIFVTTSCGSSEPSKQNITDEPSSDEQAPQSPDIALEDDPNGQPNQAIILNPNAKALQERIFAVAKSTLLQVNQTINQGETLSSVQNNCIIGFDKELGNPILNLECRPNDTFNSSEVDVHRAAVRDTADCRTDLQNNTSERCQIIDAEIFVQTRWLQLGNENELTRRPQPDGGAILNYNIAEDRLSLTNLPEAITGFYTCVFFLSTGQESIDNQTSNCQSQMPRTIALIDHYLNASK